MYTDVCYINLCSFVISYVIVNKIKKQISSSSSNNNNNNLKQLLTINASDVSVKRSSVSIMSICVESYNLNII